ncbi:AAA family ATPase [Saccharopolyspora halophila]|uniref:AAA family ATPase n=1 Tax=Saccharopolyspora halophila TaxID=405551 RepID=UPI0031DC988B
MAELVRVFDPNGLTHRHHACLRISIGRAGSRKGALGPVVSGVEIDRFVVVTGGPGSGKSTLLEALSRDGLSSTEEAGRGVIQDQVAIGGPALPWSDRTLFAELMLAWEMRSYRWAQRRSGLVLFDRGVPDVVGYLRLAGLTVPAHVYAAARKFRYHQRVLMAPPWPEIFEQDDERRQDLAEAERTYEAMVEVYAELDYQIIDLPRADVATRVEFVAKRICPPSGPTAR